jgi:pantetheine-phosphate adenylyltransferase
MKRRVVYPGTFDPITNGHLDIIDRASTLFDEVIVAVVEKGSKETIFSLDERRDFILDSVSSLSNVKVSYFSGLLVDFAQKNNSTSIIRGLRVLSDFEYEFKMALMNRSLNNNVTTLFMMPHQKYTHISSSLIREIASLGGDLSEYVSPRVESALRKKYD